MEINIINFKPILMNNIELKNSFRAKLGGFPSIGLKLLSKPDSEVLSCGGGGLDNYWLKDLSAISYWLKPLPKKGLLIKLNMNITT